LYICAFADTFFLTLPIFSICMVLVILNTEKAYKYALFGTLGIFLGVLAAYFIKHFA